MTERIIDLGRVRDLFCEFIIRTRLDNSNFCKGCPLLGWIDGDCPECGARTKKLPYCIWGSKLFGWATRESILKTENGNILRCENCLRENLTFPALSSVKIEVDERTKP